MFDTVAISFPGKADSVLEHFVKHEINIRRVNADLVSISFDETTSVEDVHKLYTLFSEYAGKPATGTLCSLNLESRIHPLDQTVRRGDNNFL